LIVEEFKANPNSEAQIFTLVSEYPLLKTQNLELKIITALPTRLNNLFIKYTKHKIRLLSTIFDYRNLIVFYPFFMRVISRKIKKYHPNKLIISSFAIAKNLELGTWNLELGTKLYLHSPMQYIRSHYDEYTAKLK